MKKIAEDRVSSQSTGHDAVERAASAVDGIVNLHTFASIQ